MGEKFDFRAAIRPFNSLSWVTTPTESPMWQFLWFQVGARALVGAMKEHEERSSGEGGNPLFPFPSFVTGQCGPLSNVVEFPNKPSRGDLDAVMAGSPGFANLATVASGYLKPELVFALNKDNISDGHEFSHGYDQHGSMFLALLMGKKILDVIGGAEL